MEFLFNQSTVIKVCDFNPNTTILQWLRNNAFIGTKEGCASGDCGACVAVVGELVTLDNNKPIVEYCSVNTCITLMATMAGKHLITVEGLSQNGVLHPVQDAMVKEHGSQCGFCTPGFVMSLFALYCNCTQDEINIDKINHALSGNLCRCTGYKSIIDAAFSCFKNKKNYNDYYVQNKDNTINTLSTLQQNKNFCFDGFYYNAPQNITELNTVLANNDNTTIFAGSSDLGLEITQNLKEFKHIVYIREVVELKTIIDNNNDIEIGSALSYEKITNILVKNFPALKNFLNRFGSKPIRNWATIGGNIANASPIGDMPPVLIVLGAQIKLTCNDSTNQTLLENFFIDYKKTIIKNKQYIQSVIIPKLKADEKLVVYKISKRFEDDISIVCLALKATIINHELKDIDIVFGAMAAIPKRAKMLEKTIMQNWGSNNLDELIFDTINLEFTPLTDVRASANHRIKLASNLVIKALLEIQEKAVLDLSKPILATPNLP